MNTPHPSGRLLAGAKLGTNSPLGMPVTGRYNVNRTDAGKDYGNIQGQIVAVGPGVISKIWQGLRGFGTTVIERLATPVNVGGRTYTDIYYAGESGAGTPTVHEGEQVQQGTEIAPGLGSGGIEVGFWDTSTGAAVGHYTEGGGPTQAGQDFVTAAAGGGSAGITRPGGDTTGGSATSGGAKQILQAWQDLRDMPRTAPPTTKNPFLWWLNSFTGKWGGLMSGAAAAAGGAATDIGSGSGLAWQVRASAEESSSGAGWTELSTNGNAAAATGRVRTASDSGGWDFATLGKMYPKGTQLKITDPTSGKSGIFPLTDYGNGSSFAPAIGLTPAVQQAIGWSGGDVIIELANGNPLSLATGFGTPR